MVQGYESFRKYVNPMIARRAELAGEPWQIQGCKDGKLIDIHGATYEDFSGTQAFGHRNPIITQAVQNFLSGSDPSFYPTRVSPYAGLFADKLCTRASVGGSPYSWVTLSSSGSEANEAAIKLARAVTRRPRLLGLDRAYHGATLGSCSVMGKGPYRDPFGPYVEGAFVLPWDNVDALESELNKRDVAAVIVEPIQLEGGIRSLSPEYVRALCELTLKYGTLLIADEIQTGLGRTGKFLRTSDWPRRPDVITLAKHLGGGLVPLSAMMSRMDLYEKAYGANFETAESHGSTFGGSSLECVAGMATLDLLDDQLIRGVQEKGEFLRQEIHSVLKDLPLYQEVRGQGFAFGIALNRFEHPWLSFDHFGMGDLSGQCTTGFLMCQRLYERGFFCLVCGHDWSVLRILPRFNLETSVLNSFVTAVREELEKLCELT